KTGCNGSRIFFSFSYSFIGKSILLSHLHSDRGTGLVLNNCIPNGTSAIQAISIKAGIIAIAMSGSGHNSIIHLLNRDINRRSRTDLDPFGIWFEILDLDQCTWKSDDAEDPALVCRHPFHIHLVVGDGSFEISG